MFLSANCKSFTYKQINSETNNAELLHEVSYQQTSHAWVILMAPAYNIQQINTTQATSATIQEGSKFTTVQ